MQVRKQQLELDMGQQTSSKPPTVILRGQPQETKEMLAPSLPKEQAAFMH